MLDKIIGVDEAGKILGLSPGTIKNMCAAGKLYCKKIGKSWVLTKEELYMMKWEMLNETNSTILEGEIELRTTQDPYVTDDGKYYKAHAIDVFGGEYEITWEVIDFETTDESSACDWDNPVDVTIVG